MSRSDQLLLALDFGGTKLSAALIERRANRWLGVLRRPSPVGADSQSDIAIVTELADELLGGRTPAAIGVSFGGPVWADSGTVKLSHHVPGWENVPLARLLEERFAAPAGIENDGIIAALGEHRYGAGRGVDSLLYLTASTGVGGGLIIGGRIWHGRDGMAGHVGHLRLEQDGPPCVCGSRGCLESISSGPSIAAEARRRLQLDPERGRALSEITNGDHGRLTGKHVADCALAGDELAREVMARAGTFIGIGIGSAANLLNPDLVLVGGGVSKAGEPLWGPLRRAARETAMPEVDFDLEPASLGDDAPLWGAVALAEGMISEAREAAG